MTEISKYKVSFAPEGSIHEILVKDGNVIIFDRTLLLMQSAPMPFNTADFFFLEEINPQYILKTKGQDKIFPSILDAIDWWLNLGNLMPIEPEDGAFWEVVLPLLNNNEFNNN